MQKAQMNKGENTKKKVSFTKKQGMLFKEHYYRHNEELVSEANVSIYDGLGNILHCTENTKIFEWISAFFVSIQQITSLTHNISWKHVTNAFTEVYQIVSEATVSRPEHNTSCNAYQ